MPEVVILTRQVQKRLARLPQHVLVKLARWIELVEAEGLAEARRIPGLHDEPLKGTRSGQRSVRFSRKYRAIYHLEGNADQRVVVLEVTPHEY